MQEERIKSILENAEVKAPRRVWRNVASQLDAAAAPEPVVEVRSKWPAMRWAGMSVAFAALAIGAFVFTSRPSKEPQIQILEKTISEAPLAQAQPAVQYDAVPEPEALDAAATSVVPSAAPSKSAGNAAVQALAQETVVEPVPQATEPAEVEPSGNRQESLPGKTAPAADEPDGSAAEAFERMAREEEDSFRPGLRSLYAQGSIGGNDSDISFSAGRARYSSGTSVLTTGVTELGDSEFGIPLSFGLGARFYLAPRFSIGTGLDYSLLSRTFQGKYQHVGASGTVDFSTTGTVHHTMHYLGIPVNAYYDIISSGTIKFYVYGGGEVEFCLGNNYSIYSSETVNWSSKVDRPQWSVGAGLGVEFKLSDHLGLYLDPSAKYYFPCYQPKNVRTERPFMFNFDAGLRFNF